MVITAIDDLEIRCEVDGDEVDHAMCHCAPQIRADYNELLQLRAREVPPAALCFACKRGYNACDNIRGGKSCRERAA
jgi:hypothetical protein